MCIRDRKPWLYMGMLAVATVSSFYFTYMICIFVAIYALLRYLMLLDVYKRQHFLL